MNRKQYLAGLQLLICMCLGNGASAGDNWVVRFDGVGPVKVGMALSQLNAALHEKFTLPPNKEDQGCFHESPSGRPHIAFMIEDGQLVRVEVDSPGIATVEGIQVGDSEARVRQVYSTRVKVTKHAYIDTGHYLTVRSPDGRYGIRFETENGKIGD